MKKHVIRLMPNQDLKKEIVNLIVKEKIRAGYVTTCVGSLKKATIRLADDKSVKTWEERFEIVSIVGTVSPGKCHLHIALADKEGKVVGGHLKEGCLIHTTAEIIITEDEDRIYERVYNKDTGFDELSIRDI
ncbi:DNA-binding protein [Patescibacteria group bacterium]|nr:DNA-binding protein [Patescibacteria group bacterium]MBU1074766.1 DNA-binding protein [Patescibacteria group bacterium]MBU1951512.1 DNA-binding protein [Patescibacteria group bacterium]